MQQKEITHLREAAAPHIQTGVAELYCPARIYSWGHCSERGKRVKTVRINHLRAALLVVAAAGLLAAVGLFVVVLYAQPAEANFPGKPGKIAYAGYDGQDYEIYTINPNGGGKKQLTDNSLDDRYPAYSPSGKKIAYSGGEGQVPNVDSEIY